MKSKKWPVRVLKWLPLLGAVVAVALVVVFASRGSTTQVTADSPHAGLNFHIAVDTNGGADDCDTLDSTGSVPPKCSVALNTAFTVKVYLDSLGGVIYSGMDVTANYSGVTSQDNADSTWPECRFTAAFYAPGLVSASCGVGVPPAPQSSTFTGVVVTMGFTCGPSSISSTITLVHGEAAGNTSLTDISFVKHDEGAGATETLTVHCGNPPTFTRTPTLTPTLTRTPTITSTPTNTLTPTVSPTPSNTPTATPLPSDQPDVTITKTDSPDPVAAGGGITYSLVVKNIGQQTATGIIASDSLPSEVVFSSANSSGATCIHDGSPTGGEVDCTLSGSLAQNEQVKIVIQVTAPTPVADEHITNLAAVFASNEPFFNQGNNSDFEQTVVLSPRPDLVLTKVDQADPVVSEGEIIYDLTADNIGPEPAEDVVIKDKLPAGAVYDDGNSSAECDPGGGGPDPDVGQVDVLCTLGTVAGQSVVHIAVTAPLVTQDTIMVNLAYISSSNELFTQTGNNLDGEFTAVLAPDPDITIDKTGPVHVKRTESFQYTLTVTNIGLGDAFNVQVSDTLPMTSINSINQPMTLQSAVGATCGAVVNQMFTCSIAELDANGGQVVITLDVRAPTVEVNTDLTNQAGVSDPDEPGEPTGNNADSQLTQIRACFDVTGDNAVRVNDILAAVDRYNAQPPNPLYDLLYDFDGNGRISVSDILDVIEHYRDDVPCLKLP